MKEKGNAIYQLFLLALSVYILIMNAKVRSPRRNPPAALWQLSF